MANKIPKKYLKTRKIAITTNYGAMISVWIADTPHSIVKPKIVVTLAHKNNKCSFVFDNEWDMVDMFNSLATGLEQDKEDIGIALKDALDDMHDYRLWKSQRKSRKSLSLMKVKSEGL